MLTHRHYDVSDDKEDLAEAPEAFHAGGHFSCLALIEVLEKSFTGSC